MAKNTQLTNLAVNGQADFLTTLLGGGLVKIYDGVQPATGDTALSGNTLLVTLILNATAFPAAVAGVLTANAITAGVAVASGTASWCRVCKSDGTAVFDGTVGTATSNVILPTTTVTLAQTVTCSGLTHTVAKSTASS